MTGGAAGLRGRLPLHPGTLRRVLAGVLLLSCAEFVRSGLYAGYLPQVVGDLLGLPKADAVVFSGSAFTAHFIADTAMRGPAGAALLRFGLRPVVLAGAALSLLGLFLMSVTHTGWVLLLAAALHGAGFSPLWPAVMSLTTASAHSTHQGRVLTTVSMSVMPFIGLSVLTLGALADAPRSAVFGLCLGLLAASLALGLLLPQRLPAATAAPASPSPWVLRVWPQRWAASRCGLRSGRCIRSRRCWGWATPSSRRAGRPWSRSACPKRSAPPPGAP